MADKDDSGFDEFLAIRKPGAHLEEDVVAELLERRVHGRAPALREPGQRAEVRRDAVARAERVLHSGGRRHRAHDHDRICVDVAGRGEQDFGPTRTHDDRRIRGRGGLLGHGSPPIRGKSGGCRPILGEQ